MRGGARAGAGRKPKADEVQVIEAMDAVMTPTEAWAALSEKVKDGDTQAIKTWLNYRYGMPKQQVDSNVNVTEFMAPIIKLTPSDE